MKPPKRRPGPVANPYGKGDLRWFPRGPRDALFRAGIPLWQQDPIYSHEAQVAHRIYLILERVRVPVLRRYLESVALHRWGIEPEMVRRVLDNYRRFAPASAFATDTVTNVAIKKQSSATYGLRKLSEKEQTDLGSLIDLRESVLTGDVLGRVGEEYVRSHLKRSDRFENVTKLVNAGFRRAGPGQNRPDLFATCKRCDTRFVISVKNDKEPLEARDYRIGQAIRMASHRDAKGATPWLIVPFGTDTAIESCAKQNLRVSLIGTRIAPQSYDGKKSTGKFLRDVYATLGPEPWAFISETIRKRDGDTDLEVTRVRQFDAAFIARLRHC